MEVAGITILKSYGGAISESQAPYWKILSFK